MPDFSEFADDAKKFAGEHDQQSDEAFDKAAQFADDKTGNKFDSQIQSGENAAENYAGVQDQDQQGQQGQQGQGGYGQDQNQGQGGDQYGGGQDQGQGGYDQNQGQGDQYGDQSQGDQGQGGGQYGDQQQGQY